MSGRIYDVAIVGTGPAGMFAALELKEQKPELDVIMFEMGFQREFGNREDLTSGWGGAGAFSDGKLVLSHKVGGELSTIIGLSRFEELMKYIDEAYLKFGAKAEIIWGDEDEIERWVRKAHALNLILVPTKTRHIGSDRTLAIVDNIKNVLESRGVSIILRTVVKSCGKNGRGVFKIVTSDGIFYARRLIVAPGRSGAEWFSEEAKRLGLKILSSDTNVDIGVRVEIPAFVLAPLTDLLYDPKIKMIGQNTVRTFCVCPHGWVTIERYKDLLTTVNGHSFEQAGMGSRNTNFALLVSTRFTEPFREPIKYAKSIADRTNDLGGGKPLVQRLGDLMEGSEGRRSTLSRISESKVVIQPTLLEATPGDITYAIPYKQMKALLLMIEKLDGLVGGIKSPHTLLYAAEVKFYSVRVERNENLETAVGGLYAIGDGAGYTRGLMQASMEGVIAARDIINKLSKSR